MNDSKIICHDYDFDFCYATYYKECKKCKRNIKLYNRDERFPKYFYVFSAPTKKGHEKINCTLFMRLDSKNGKI
jgi:hypothetical protein